MNSQIDIHNAALIEIGGDALLGPTDDSRESRLCNYRYPDARESTLRAHFWNCAMKRASLARLANDPPFGFGAAFQLPADFLRAKEINPCDAWPWKIEGRALLTNADHVDLVYVFDLTDVSKMDVLLCQAIALKLASSIANALKGDLALASMMFQKWKDMLDEGRYMDANEGNFDRMTPTAFTDARHTGPFGH